MIGLKELALLAVLIVTLYGRSGVLRSERFQAIWPWIAPVRRPPRRPGGAGASAARRGNVGDEGPSRAQPMISRRRPWLPRLDGNRLFWFVTVLAATAVAAWVVTRVLIVSRASGGGLH